MRIPILPSLMLLALAAALYLLPDGAISAWRLWFVGTLARLDRPAADDTRIVPPPTLEERDLMDVIHQKNAEIADLNRRLRDIGITKENVPAAKIIPAKVIRLGPAGDLDTFTLDVGNKDGAEPGHAVVVGRSLVGLIVKCEENASLALSLSSPGCYISARLGEPEGAEGGPRQLGAVRGAGGNRVRVVVFSSANPAKEDWLAMTSGLERSVPEGLMLGVIAGGFEDGVESGTMEAALRPFVDLSSLDYVTVVAGE